MTHTELVYSSHDRCEYLHREWLVQRALERPDDKSLLYLPISSGARPSQEYSWGTFSGYLDRFREWGLEPRCFFWEEGLRREDVQLFFDWLRHSAVVILGGGRTLTGMERYRDLGGRFFGNADAFVQTLWARHEAGLLTAGFSAGADQLCQYSCDGDDGFPPMFGLVHDVVVQLHYEPSRAEHVRHMARRFPGCLCFGLPNDSGIAANQGRTEHGNTWQLLQFVTDNSWDRPEDQHHIKTRQGVKIEHAYADGRAWGFNGGDVLLRVFYGDGSWEAWIKRPEVPRFHAYGSQQETGWTSMEDILRDR